MGGKTDTTKRQTFKYQKVPSFFKKKKKNPNEKNNKPGLFVLTSVRLTRYLFGWVML